MFGAIGKLAKTGLKVVGKGILNNQKDKAIGQGISAFKSWKAQKDKPKPLALGKPNASLGAAPKFGNDENFVSFGGYGMGRK